VRRRHREVPVCVTWTVPCAMALLCPHLVVLMARSLARVDAECVSRSTVACGRVVE